ncbi:hypothetical protein D9619_013342 [Psilocybe cf. subviscida]|uniref:14-3-3 domain-containing protein n=1 Tax=Psilocybe cf. subviscida TaxID=2480587 RepID=A0A8H5BS63_9AGAR|nr:hypothetical protein D9619_013342 [Psilocybe cf. subviscida]
MLAAARSTGCVLSTIEPESRDSVVARAALAVDSSRYRDAVSDLLLLAAQDILLRLSHTECEILRIAVGHTLLRASFSREQLRTEQPLDSETSLQTKSSLRAGFLHRIEDEQADVCRKLINMVQNQLIPRETNPPKLVFYYSLQGDLCRSLFECSTPLDVEAIRKAKTAYELGSDICSGLPPVHPIRLRHRFKHAQFILPYSHDVESAKEVCFDEHSWACEFLDSVDHNELADCTPDTYILMDGILSSAIRWIEGTCPTIDERNGNDRRAELERLTGGMQGSTKSRPNAPKDAPVSPKSRL